MFSLARHQLSSTPRLSSLCNSVARRSSPAARSLSNLSRPGPLPVLPDSPPTVVPSPPPTSTSASPSPSPSSPSPNEASLAGPKPPPPQPEKAVRKAPLLKASKAAMTLTPTAVDRLRALVSGPTPQLIRVGVRNKGCAGMAYDLQYVDKAGRFDEVVEQDGVRVLIDSKALFSIIGSEMDWKEDRMSSKFVFKNPNVVDACGCGESFNVETTL